MQATICIRAVVSRVVGASREEKTCDVVLAISDLDRGIEQLGNLCGVMPVRGGEHGHAGTENALLSMGPRAYIEVLAPQVGAQLPMRMTLQGTREPVRLPAGS